MLSRLRMSVGLVARTWTVELVAALMKGGVLYSLLSKRKSWPLGDPEAAVRIPSRSQRPAAWAMESSPVSER